MLDPAPQNPRFYNRYYEIPRNPSSAFTQRDDVYTQLREACLPSDDPALQPRQRRFVLYGLGGSGKTQLCLKFAEEYREKCVSQAHGVILARMGTNFYAGSGAFSGLTPVARTTSSAVL